MGGFIGLAGCACLVACGSFTGTDLPAGAGDAGTSARDAAASVDAAISCGTEACPAGKPSCHFDDFSSGDCPGAWLQKGDIGMSTVVWDCKGGKLHLAADQTKDVWADLAVSVPAATKVIHVSATIAITAWSPKKPVLTVTLGSSSLILFGEMNVDGNPQLTACTANTSCAPPQISSREAPHVFTLDLAPSGVVTTVDCASPLAPIAGFAIDPSTPLHIVFGTVDGAPIDGTLDDVRVSFE